MDFKMATGEFARMQQNLIDAAKLNEQMKVSQDFSLGDDEVLIMKPMANKKKKKSAESKENFDNSSGFLPPPSDAEKKKKSKKKSKEEETKVDDKLFGDFTNANDGDDGS